ncbi:tetratricopeptide repeat protein [Deferribacter autotrophicus]|uniref:Tetratricopeptide repeat protein n=1 Tax=Deferribacter autotrophicus TaxID=500465 RepID=A0A5A8F582_9BACT|nr:tetratricopeptide repeat protein [Deferribacter autotrophicus]KAA0259172.1 tetratricopeptide repeat protein [Deferribacter autotrophicus]
MRLFKSKELDIQDIKKLFLKGQLKKALKECKKYLSNKENDYDAWNLFGDIQFRLGNKSDALETYKRLIAKLEDAKYIDKVIAQIKKVLKFFPEEYELYRKLAQAFEKKGLIGEQLNTLIKLSDIYEKNGLVDKSIDILKEITEIDRSNILNFKLVLERLDKFQKSFEICKFLYSALKVAHERFQKEQTEHIKEYIIYFSEIGLKHKCDLTEVIPFMLPYFQKNEDKKNVLIEFGRNYLTKTFDYDFYNFLKKYYPINMDLDFYNELKEHYKEPVIYRDLVNYYLNNDDYENLSNLIKEINELPDYDFKIEFIQVIKGIYDKIDDDVLLDLMVTLAGKCKAKDLQIAIYKRLAEIYSSRKDTEKADRILNYINDLEYGISLESHEEYGPDLEGEDKTSLEDLEFGKLEEVISEDKKEEDTVETTISGLETTVLGPDFVPDTDESFELDVDLDLRGEQEVKGEEKKDDDVLLEDELADVISIEELDLTGFEFIDEKKEDESLKSRLAEIEELINSGQYEKAKGVVDDLLLEYPDNEKVKDYASKIFLFFNELEDSGELIDLDEFVEGEAVTGKKIIQLDKDEKTLVENIRKSINEKVSPDDYETHYDLALAYFEMELYEDAVEEFKKASYGSKKYESLYMLAECYKKMGKYDNAINVHKLILADFDDIEKVKNSLYELALVYEIKGDKKIAKVYFDKLANIDMNFRDLKEKLKQYPDYEISDSENISDENEKTVKKKKRKKKISFL